MFFWKISKNIFLMFLFLLKISFRGIFSCFEIWLKVAKFKKNVLICIITVIKVEVKTILEAIVIRNGTIVWKHRPHCWYFCLNLKYLRWPYRAYIKTAKNGDFCQELLSKNDFEAVLVAFCCYDHGAKASEEVQKIATDQKEYRKCSLCVIICWIAKI